jgi:hypothetical protein
MRGVVYNTANPPSDPFFQLTNEDIISLMNQAVGLPIRVEHETHDVGRVVSASFNGVDAVVEWEFSENASGWTAEKLVELQQIKELSLKHVAYENGNKKPLEVSLVRKGARPATHIITEQYKGPNETPGKTDTIVMASETAAGTPVAPASAIAVSAEVAAPQVEGAVAPAPKVVQRSEDGRFTSQPATDEPAAKRGKFETPLEFINSISTRINDGETMQLVADYIAQGLEANIANEHEIKSLKEAKAILEQAQVAHVGASKNVVGDIAKVLTDIFSQFAKDTQISEESKNAFMETMSQNTAAMEFVRPILVAASAIHQVAAKNSEAKHSVELEKTKARLATLTDQMSAARKMQPAASAPAVQPGWTTMPAPAFEAAPQQVMVAASGAHSAAPPPFKMPDIIGSLTSYKDQGSVGMFTPSMLSKRM